LLLLLLLLSKGREMSRDDKQRALRVIGVEDVNRKLDIAVNEALDPVDHDLTDLRSAVHSQQQRNNQLHVREKFTLLFSR